MTKLIYLNEPNLYKTYSKITKISQNNDLWEIVLDQTIFYVQGGGQPSDTGKIQNKDGVFHVVKVFKSPESEIIHSGYFDSGVFETGKIVELIVDEGRRKLHSRIHSSGHLIDLAVHNLSLNWLPSKAYHFPQGSYVEYSLPNNQIEIDKEKLMIDLQSEINVLIDSNLEFSIRIDNEKELQGKPLRLLSIDKKVESPCAGTHVSNSNELTGLSITKIKVKNGMIKVGYSIS